MPFVIYIYFAKQHLQRINIFAGKYLSVSLILAFDTLQELFIKIADFANGLPCGFPYPDRQKVFRKYISHYFPLPLKLYLCLFYCKASLFHFSLRCLCRDAQSLFAQYNLVSLLASLIVCYTSLAYILYCAECASLPPLAFI